MDNQQGRFMKAISEVKVPRGNAYVSTLEAIAEYLGIDPITNMDDRKLYREVMLSLQRDGYLDCMAINYGVECAIVRITSRGEAYLES